MDALVVADGKWRAHELLPCKQKSVVCAGVARSFTACGTTHGIRLMLLYLVSQACGGEQQLAYPGVTVGEDGLHTLELLA